jgi:hypothetical protein
MTMGEERTPPIAQVPKDLTREELSIAFRVIDALRGLRFGSVQLQVHEGKVVQIDVAEKLRLWESPPRSAPPPLRTDRDPAERKD